MRHAVAINEQRKSSNKWVNIFTVNNRTITNVTQKVEQTLKQKLSLQQKCSILSKD